MRTPVLAFPEDRWYRKYSLLFLGFYPLNLKIFYPFVTESKLIPLTTQQADKLRDEVLGQGMGTVFRKPAD